jgi:hypothetical protein
MEPLNIERHSGEFDLSEPHQQAHYFWLLDKFANGWFRLVRLIQNSKTVYMEWQEFYRQEV